jgi:hypothetical protein
MAITNNGSASTAITQLTVGSSADLASIITDESGSGVLAFTISPTFTTPTLGVASATSLNKISVTAPATSATLTLADGSSLITAGAFATTLTATATTGVTLPTTGTLATRAGTETLTNKTLDAGIITGTLTAGGSVGTSGQFLTSTGTGVQYTTVALVNQASMETIIAMGAY